MAFDAEEKTHDPTPRRRLEMRKRGQVARSGDLSSVVLLLGGLVVLAVTGPALVDYLAAMLVGSLSGHSWRQWLTADGSSSSTLATQQFGALADGLASALLPVLGLIVLVTLGGNLLQTGFLFLPSRLAPDFSRTSPWSGIRRLFSSSTWMRLVFGLAKTAAVSGVAAATLYSRREELLSIGGLELSAIGAVAWNVCLGTCVNVGLALAALAACDYLWQWLRIDREARMTPQEVRDEMRELGGGAHSAARRRSWRRDSAVVAHASARVESVSRLD